MAKQSKDRVCVDCGKAFTGNPRARYCPDCRALRRGGTNIVEVTESKPGPFQRLMSFFEPLKKYLSFWRLVIVNIILLIIGFGYAWYLHSQPWSPEIEQTIEAYTPTNLALTALLIWGCCMRFFYWHKNRTTTNPFWSENYWKQLIVWLGGIVFTEIWAVFFLVT